MSDDSDPTAGLPTTDDTPDPCGLDNYDDNFGLRIGSVFVILVTSLVGTLLPIVLRQSRVIPRPVFEFAKYFGSGVIIATAFIHLLAPAFDELGSDCLSGTWTEYDWAPAFAMLAVYCIFFAEIAAYRIGTARLEKLGLNYSSHNADATDAHAHNHQIDPPLNVDTSAPEAPHHGHPSLAVHDSDYPLESGRSKGVVSSPNKINEKNYADAENGSSNDDDSTVNHLPSQAEAVAQLVAVAVLEFGVIFHSVIIGLTLAVNQEFVTLFVVIIFHQMFEGLGLGSRLSGLILPKNLNWTRYLAAVAYAICTPIGIAIGLGVRNTYNGNGATANIVSGVLDALSAGILLYTGLVELLAHEILLNPRMMKSSSGKLTYVFCCILLGSGLMALLGRWA